MSEAAATPSAIVAPALGLGEAEAARILAARGAPHRPPTSRSYSSIVRANVLTLFNLVLAVFGGLTLAFGEWRDALFLGVLLANTTIGITQEVRAKRALDRLAALVAPRATVVRDGAERQVSVEEVVPGDLLRVQAGDQFVADGTLVEAGQLRLDESVLTGESRAVSRAAGEEVRSGSFAVEGTGAYLAAYQENLQASESRIRDVDMAKEMVNFTKLQILSQAGTAVLAQANQASQGVLTLLRG